MVPKKAKGFTDDTEIGLRRRPKKIRGPERPTTVEENLENGATKKPIAHPWTSEMEMQRGNMRHI